MTYTYAILDVSPAAYKEIADKLRAAGYDQAFHAGVIDMHGIGLHAEEVVPSPPPPRKHDWYFYANGTFCRRCGTQIGSGYECR